MKYDNCLIKQMSFSVVNRQLWLRYVEVSLDKILNPKTAPDVLVSTLHGSHRYQCMNVCVLAVMYVSCRKLVSAP